MTILIKKAGSIYYFLLFLLFILFSLVTPSLAARGSGEFSEDFKNDLRVLFEELVLKVESRERSGLEAKSDLALLRSKYRVEYNDFAGKADALIDEVEENKQKAGDAFQAFIIIQNELIVMREQLLKEDIASLSKPEQKEDTASSSAPKESKEVNSSPADGGSEPPGKRN